MLSSVGRVFPSHGKGQEFEPPSVHHLIMFETENILNITYAIAFLKRGDILVSFVDGKKTFFALKKEKVLIQNQSISFMLSFKEFESLYSQTKFIVYDPNAEVEIDTKKDEEYYSYDVLKY